MFEMTELGTARSSTRFSGIYYISELSVERNFRLRLGIRWPNPEVIGRKKPGGWGEIGAFN